MAEGLLGMAMAFFVSLCLVAARVSRLMDWLGALLGITFVAFAVRDWIERHQREDDEKAERRRRPT